MNKEINEWVKIGGPNEFIITRVISLSNRVLVLKPKVKKKKKIEVFM